MRWVRFESNGVQGIGSQDGEWIQPVRAQRLLDVLAPEQVQAEGPRIARSQVRILAPLRPGKIVAVGQNYRDHCREQNVRLPERPILFAKYPTSVIGPQDAIRWPETLTAKVDFEAELAVVIGQRAARLDAAHAADVIFGLTAVNDVSARDLQHGDGQWVRGKSLDTFCPLGPAVVTLDEIADLQDLSIRCRVNGQVVQDSNTREMIFPVRELLAFITAGITLEPGDIVLTGTPHGVGAFRQPPLFLKPGDVVEVEVGDFGTLVNPVGPYRD
ncbi:MAG: fumarylacetoacetate hydrolase family protein [Vicinamibacteria bacterium]|jgi:2-keto-4-pentenoate hydratase/2-oxohepta-3-ene-1,7-dioic acid hydratase in catechol pathway|nr:fumarylacetoacetate hydrolase family protein [Vicinamibacteria bacterium]